jgi:hypothetical protein
MFIEVQSILIVEGVDASTRSRWIADTEILVSTMGSSHNCICNLATNFVEGYLSTFGEYCVLILSWGRQQGIDLERRNARALVLGRLLIDAPFVPLLHETVMSAVPSTSTSHSNFVPIFNAALETYKRKTKKDLTSHQLLPTLQSCDSPEAILTVLREQVPAVSQSQNGDDGLAKWVTPTVNVFVFIFRHPRRGCWAGEYPDVSSRIMFALTFSL